MVDSPERVRPASRQAESATEDSLDTGSLTTPGPAEVRKKQKKESGVEPPHSTPWSPAARRRSFAVRPRRRFGTRSDNSLLPVRLNRLFHVHRPGVRRVDERANDVGLQPLSEPVNGPVNQGRGERPVE